MASDKPNRTDYLGREKSEEEIASLAEAWRIALGVNSQTNPDILWAVEAGLPRFFPHFALTVKKDSELVRDFAATLSNPPRIEARESVYKAAAAKK